ncbi:cytochrome P450 [Mycena albidolilacea]|uniref:Cytochrome P450 n=1 Tax=Mycena albidolilacea TaxID=1033008 RepID=A0AAD7A5R7_9AGAR|nr:cytochrome P450 [Mycena albidolilacea]
MSLRLLKNMAKAPTEFYQHIPRFPASLVFALAFGRKMKHYELAEVQRILADFVFEINPGAHLVDTFPVSDLLPDFLSPWRDEARRKRVRELSLPVPGSSEAYEGRFRAGMFHRTPGGIAGEVQHAQRGDLLHCQHGFRLRHGHERGDDALIRYDGGSVPRGGEESAGRHRHRVQREHAPRLLADEKDLLYCFALLKEVVRWSPIVPLSFPHYLDVDDEYKGYKVRLPYNRPNAGQHGKALLVQHDEEEFPNSYKFEPGRFMTEKPGQTDGTDSVALGEGMYGFGFGRRECPGQKMSTKSAWIAIFRLLWAFNMEAVLDASGKPTTIDTESCTEGLTWCVPSHLIFFPFRLANLGPTLQPPSRLPANFVARSAAHIETIMSS